LAHLALLVWQRGVWPCVIDEVQPAFDIVLTRTQEVYTRLAVALPRTTSGTH
jgi:hypothetical protein